MAQSINITVPTSWSDLTQEQLRFLLGTIAKVNRNNAGTRYRSREDYTAQTTAQVATLCLFHWGGIHFVCPWGDGYLLHVDGREAVLTSADIAPALLPLAWTAEIPTAPVRLETVDGAAAVPADIASGFSFDSWLACENLWQGYIVAPADETLRLMAEILYNKPGIRLNAAESLGIFYWWASLKNMLAAMFPNFFKGVVADNTEPPSYDEMRRNIDAQIRALTKGDITKEHQILSMDAMRALTELDAQAREYDEIRKKYPEK